MVPARISVSATSAAPAEESKRDYDDRIAPVGTAYEPVKLSTPGKLANRWNPGAASRDLPEPAPAAPSLKDRMAAFSGGGGNVSTTTPQPSGKKLTWSERQADTKRRREEDEKKSAGATAAGEGLVMHLADLADLRRSWNGHRCCSGGSDLCCH